MRRHLIYSMNEALFNCGVRAHPQLIMQELGIKYQYSVPQSMVDLWEFWNCENIPDNLPSYLSFFDIDPMERIGFGLSEKMAKEILNYKVNTNKQLGG